MDRQTVQEEECASIYHPGITASVQLGIQDLIAIHAVLGTLLLQMENAMVTQQL